MPSSTLIASTILWLLLQLSQAADQPSYQPCPLLRAYYDAPVLSKTSDAVKSLSNDFDAVFDNLTRSGGSEDYGAVTPDTTSFSVVLFSEANDNSTVDPVFYSYHYTAPAAGGKVKVNGDTTFALGGLTQLFTVYAWLVEMGVETWNDPITKYLPELKTASCDSNFTVAWDTVTIQALAGHMAGIARDSNVCELGAACDRNAFITSFATMPALFLPNTTPIFSHAAFQLLAFAITSQNMSTKAAFPDILTNSILHPLNLTRTTLLSPFNSGSLLGHPVSPSQKGEQASLSLLSNPHDLALAGSSILSSALLPASTTRRWLSPSSADTSNIRNGAGQPWEVYRAPITSQLIIDILLKSGEVGAYSSYLGLLPDMGVGFAILAHDESGKAADLNVYADVVADGLSGILKVAALQSAGRYSGAYSGPDGLAVFGADAWPGLVVENITVGGRDVRAEVAKDAGIEIGNLDYRVYPTNIWDVGAKRHQFVGVVQDKDALVDAGTPTCITWMNGIVQGAGGRVVFGLDDEGMASSVEVAGLGGSLNKAGT
ncbi:Beta-lactamase/transpeptidase-like protein [Coniochaeta hoffmannii]|uniref:Beta-lactamase/transpeptidase-like protein n=1 Tax=Coniochaeta hoffmannii TaxID=91930 RepID=A0AA38SCC1_9PEZI|nr:Beta-lactamase/transpeptidase-like protein [Coniochaeta hoffmannii]